MKYFVLFFALITAHFFLPRLMRADPFVFISSDGTEVASYSEEEINKYKAYYGLDKPLWQQYVQYVAGIATANLGYSIYFKDSVVNLIFKRLVWTAGIVCASLLFSLLLGLCLGSLSAWFAGKRLDGFLYHTMTVVSEIPSFLTANAILMLFVIRWRVLPTSGGITPFLPLEFTLPVITDIIKHAVLPALTLSLLKTPDFYFVTRSAMLRQLQKKYVETAQAKSLGAFTIVVKHCLPNASNPIITRFLLSLQTLFNGALIVENVFKYPGIGRLIRDAVFYRDYLLLQGIFFVITVFILCISAVGEAVYRRTERSAV
ncbi:ABC transporter permease [Treponema sp. OMZ 305]|uniref:ABC transporter permease n=1 Tax=Treponema TaxID=157 RepID=UPI001BB0C405|nr:MULTISPECIES: ABC transporter permease [Treponema]QUY17793.1 ABC transporter permease [Treponema vincentii]UTC57666.1 ABC transporter permease [Treponema sp. OMZ 305]